MKCQVERPSLTPVTSEPGCHWVAMSERAFNPPDVGVPRDSASVYFYNTCIHIYIKYIYIHIVLFIMIVADLLLLTIAPANR